MNKRVFLAGLASALCCGTAVGEASISDLQLRIDYVTQSGQMSVSLNNAGQDRVRLWTAGKWNVAPWRVLHISAISGALTTYYMDPDQIFHNAPLYEDLLPEQPRLKDLDMNSPFWLPREKTRDKESIMWGTGDTVIVIYDVPMTREGDKRGVWWGVVAAKAVVP